MSELNNNKISDEALENVTGGNDGYGEGTYSVRDITPIWVEVTSSTLNCRYWPNGRIAKVYERGHKLKVDGVLRIHLQGLYKKDFLSRSLINNPVTQKRLQPQKLFLVPQPFFKQLQTYSLKSSKRSETLTK